MKKAGAGDKAGGSTGRAPSCGGCARREAVLSNTMRLHSYERYMNNLSGQGILLAGVVCLLCGLALRTLPRSTLITLFYTALYLTASPTAILLNKILMKDVGFGYPVMVSALGQTITAVCSSPVPPTSAGSA